MFDRAGIALKTVGEAGPFGQPSLSADGTRVAVVRNDPETGNQDVWAFDVATGRGRAITSDPSADAAPIWSPDGKHVAFVSTRGDYTGIYRKAWNGTGHAELLYQHTAGTPSVVLTDWSADGRFLSFYAGDVLYVLPLDGDRKAVEIERSEFSTIGGRFSPDARFLAYLSDESGRYEVYVRPFDSVRDTRGLPLAQPWRVSPKGAQGMISWRPDGKEIRYLASDGSFVAVGVTVTPGFQSETPSVLFRPPSQGGGGPYTATGNAVQLRNMNRAGDRFVFAVQPRSTPSSSW